MRSWLSSSVYVMPSSIESKAATSGSRRPGARDVSCGRDLGDRRVRAVI
jgi:hypothetical protein